jgi:dihydrofolate synthase/folylpolyglutamate synthase
MAMDYLEAVAYLDAHAYRGVVPGLERMRFLMDLLGDPQRTAPAVHITGTNGKGSTARLVSAVLSAGGVTTGTFTSPYLQSVTETWAFDGRPLSREDFADVMTELVPYFDHMEQVRGEGPTYFEIKTTVAFAAFAGRGVDAQVVEVGLGGRWDATNVLDAGVAVVTNVDIDHARFLGSDRLAIAAEKAGIISAGAVAVTGERDHGVLDVLRARCREVGAQLLEIGEHFDVEQDRVADGGQLIDLRTPAGVYRDLFLPLHGAHQSLNAACGLTALEAFHGGPVAEDLVREGFGSVRSPGRLEVVERDPLLVLDVAHNPHGVAALVRALPEAFSYRDLVLVVGILEDKDRAGMLPALVRGARAVIATAADDPHSVPADVLGKEAEDAGAAAVHVVPRVPDAVDRARDLAGADDLILVAGSHYSVGEARTHIVGPGPAF